MYKSIHVEITKGNFGTGTLPAQRRIWVCKHNPGVFKDIVQQVVLQVGAGEGFAILMLYSEGLPVVSLRSGGWSKSAHPTETKTYPTLGIGRCWWTGSVCEGGLEDRERRSAVGFISSRPI